MSRVVRTAFSSHLSFQRERGNTRFSTAFQILLKPGHDQAALVGREGFPCDVKTLCWRVERTPTRVAETPPPGPAQRGSKESWWRQ